MNWLLHHKIVLLSLAIVVLLAANAALFVPRYLHSQQQLTPTELQQENQKLGDLAEQAATITNAAASGDPSQLPGKLEPITTQVDEIVLELQTTRHVVSMENDVRQSLQFAQVLSFTLHDLVLPPVSSLKAAHTTQVLHQAALSAQNLNASR